MKYPITYIHSHFTPMISIHMISCCHDSIRSDQMFLFFQITICLLLFSCFKYMQTSFISIKTKHNILLYIYMRLPIRDSPSHLSSCVINVQNTNNCSEKYCHLKLWVDVECLMLENRQT